MLYTLLVNRICTTVCVYNKKIYLYIWRNPYFDFGILAPYLLYNIIICYTIYCKTEETYTYWQKAVVNGVEGLVVQICKVLVLHTR